MAPMPTSFNTGRNEQSLAVRPESIELLDHGRHSTVTLRDLAAILFRQWRVLLLSFLAILVFAIFLSGALSPTYKAEMKILVRHGRMDPVVTSQSNAPSQMMQEEVNESELNSEVELLNSHDLLQKVVLANDLQTKWHAWRPSLSAPRADMDIARAVRRLGKLVQAEPLRKTNLISVTLESSDPDQAAQILNSLGILYLEKHLQVHRPTGEFRFFDQETEQLKRGLDTAEGRLTAFSREHGVVSAQYERDLTLQKASEQEASLAQTQAAITETEHRIVALQRQATSIPQRLTTQLRTADNPQLMQQMKSTLLNLELKRSELLSKFEPTYPLVVEVEKQIRDTKATIAGEKDAPVRDETTDQNPTYEWVKSELAKGQTELSGLKARAAANQAALLKYRADAQTLQEAAIEQQDLTRTAKTEEDNYLLYLRKQEEARINDALDARGILNVAIAEPASVPVLPARSFSYYVLLCFFLACCGSVGITFLADFLDPSVRTPDEVSLLLDLPVLASIPKERQLN
jgi:uncharacterized protein involved in exopolysaccharide biosynthesis